MIKWRKILLKKICREYCVIASRLFFCRNEISLSRSAIGEKRKDFHELAIMKLRDARHRVRTNDLASAFEGFSRKNGTESETSCQVYEKSCSGCFSKVHPSVNFEKIFNKFSSKFYIFLTYYRHYSSILITKNKSSGKSQHPHLVISFDWNFTDIYVDSRYGWWRHNRRRKWTFYYGHARTHGAQWRTRCGCSNWR